MMRNMMCKQSLSLAMLWSASLLAVFNTSCSRATEASSTKSEVTLEPGVFNIEQPETFKLARIESRALPIVLTANGTVSPDVTRTIHVTSLGSGRVIELKARLGDQVRKGQELLTISSSDLGAATADYQKARADEELSRKALDRAQLLYSHGALAEKDLQVAQGAEDKAKVDIQTAMQRVRLMGGDPDHPASPIQLRAPVSGTIVIGDSADIRLNAFPGRVFRGKVGDISRVLDPSTRAAKVRVVLPNADRSLRPGMYAVATFRSRQSQDRLVIPSTAIMRLQDRDWLFWKEGPGRFRQIEVHTNGQTEDGQQQIQDGPLQAGQEIVLNALEFSTAMADRKK